MRPLPLRSAAVLLAFATLAGCSGGAGALDGETTREVEPQAFTVSYRNKVRLPWAGSTLTAERFASQVKAMDPLANARCAPQDADAFKDVSAFLGGVSWTHGMVIVKDQSLPPLYSGPPRQSSADERAESSGAAAPGQAPNIERPDLVGIKDGIAVFLSKAHGLVAVDTRSGAPVVSCSLKLPGQPSNFFFKGSEVVVVVNALAGHNRSALLRFEVKGDGFAFKDAVKLPNQNVRDARLFDATLVLYTGWTEERPAPQVPGEPQVGSGPQYGSYGGRGEASGAAAAPAREGGDYGTPVGSKVLVVKWDDALAIDWEDALRDDPRKIDPMEGRDPAQKLTPGELVSTWKSWKPFAAASDRYFTLARSVQKTLFREYQTTTYQVCTAYNPQHHQVQQCSVKYEKRPNPDYRPPNPQTGDYSCNGKKLADCIREAAPVVSEFIYVPVGQDCSMVWVGQCEKTETRSATYPTFGQEEETELLVYRFENGGFTKLDATLGKMVQKNDALAFETAPLAVKGDVASRNAIQFQNGQLYVFANDELQTLSVAGNSISFLGAQKVPGGTHSGAIVFSRDRAMISTRQWGSPTATASTVTMLDLTEPALPTLLTSFGMPGISTQLVLANGGILGPGSVSFPNGPTTRTLQKLTLFSNANGQELDNLLLGTEYDAFASSWFAADDDQRIRLASDGTRVFLPYSGRHHADEFEPTAHRLNITRLENGRLVSERSFNLSEPIVRTTSIDDMRSLVFGDASTHLVDRSGGDWALTTLKELFVPFATYRLSDTGLLARVDRVGSSCRVRTFPSEAPVFSDAPIAEAKVPCPEGGVPIGAGSALLFRETRTGVTIAPDGSRIDVLSAADVAAQLEALPKNEVCWVDGGPTGGATVDYLDAAPSRILCTSTKAR